MTPPSHVLPYAKGLLVDQLRPLGIREIRARGRAASVACVLCFLAVATIVPIVASACSIAGPATFVGHLAIHDIQTQQEHQVTFDQVGIDSLCSITNSVDVSRSFVMLQVSGGVRLFDFTGATLKDVALDATSFLPRLDGRLVYYVDGAGSLRRFNTDTLQKETILAGLAQGGIAGLEVADGIVAWWSVGRSDERLFVFDSGSRNYVVKDGPLPVELRNRTPMSLQLIGLGGSNLTFLSDFKDVYVHDFRLNTTQRVLRLDGFVGPAVREGARIVYASGGRLYTFDISRNTTTVLIEGFVGDKIRMRGDIVVYDFYRTYPGLPGFLVFTLISVAAVVVVGALFWIVRRRRQPGH
jgi:hypothetical protein